MNEQKQEDVTENQNHKILELTGKIGNAANSAHDDLIFKQSGVQIRKHVIKQIAEKLKKNGKLVIEQYY